MKKLYRIPLLILSFFCAQLDAQGETAIRIDAGPDQVINWDQQKSTVLEGILDVKKPLLEWVCINNEEVRFTDKNALKTAVVFPRPGYYLIRLNDRNRKQAGASDEVIINVFQPGQYKERLTDLIGLMTVEEKVTQLVNESDSIPRLGLAKYNYWSEALHGVLAVDATSFPQVIAMGSTWDPQLLQKVAGAISDEARVKNATEGKGLSYWSPTLNIARDPRWGRNEECYSEDPYLLSRMGVAFIRGMQGDHPYYLKTVATPKHFIANNEESRRHTGSSDVDMRSLWEYYMPAFKKAIVEGKAYSIMGAYNEVNQVPACGNYYLMTDVLRRRWNFEGYVVSDCGAIHDMVSGHHFFDTGTEAAARGLLAGCDLNCGSYYRNHLLEALEQGLIVEEDLDRALERVLSARFRLGEFDPPDQVPYSSMDALKLESQEHQELALEAAQKAMVLLKNDGILPINTQTVKTIAVIGPNAAHCELGIYSGLPEKVISPLEGITKAANEHGIEVFYEIGCGIGGGLMKPIESRYFAEIEGTGQQGMLGKYYDNMALKGSPVATQVDPMVDFSFGASSPAPGMPEDKFSIRWAGKIIPPATMTYELGTRTDDGARLWLDRDLLIDDWTEHGEKPNSVKVHLEAGKEYELVFEYYDNMLGAAARLTWDYGDWDFAPALEVAGKSDVVILVLGISPGLSGEELDRTTISLPEVQQDLILEVAALNPNIIVVLVNGGPISLDGREEYAPAILEAWYAGQAGGEALADILFGEVNPGGKLPQTFYKSTDQLPDFSNYDIINQERTYLYYDQPVLYPFGHGLSYTEFEYSDLDLSSDTLKASDTLLVSCTIKNSGGMEGDEVVQVYVSDPEASVKVPVHQLRAFNRIALKKGDRQVLQFMIAVSDLGFYDTKTNDFVVEPGEFEVQVGSSSADIRLKGSFWVEE